MLTKNRSTATIDSELEQRIDQTRKALSKANQTAAHAKKAETDLFQQIQASQEDSSPMNFGDGDNYIAARMQFREKEDRLAEYRNERKQAEADAERLKAEFQELDKQYAAKYFPELEKRFKKLEKHMAKAEEMAEELHELALHGYRATHLGYHASAPRLINEVPKIVNLSQPLEWPRKIIGRGLNRITK